MPGRATERSIEMLLKRRLLEHFNSSFATTCILSGHVQRRPTHYIMMGLDPDLMEANKLAILETLDFLKTEKKMTQEDAYVLASVGVDFVVTQCVDGTLGIHALIPKSIFLKPKK